MPTISTEDIAKTLGKTLEIYVQEKEEDFFAAIDEALEECGAEVKKHIKRGEGIRTGNYIKAFRIDTESGMHRHKGAWNVAAPHYRLTHLLEHGHLTRNGTTRTKTIKHIEYGRKIAEKILEKRINEIYGGGK